MQKVPRWLLIQRQNLSLDNKVLLSKRIIEEWSELCQGKIYIAFSGGKDSTVLLNLVRSLYPNTEAVFCNTGLEFPEIKEFVRTVPNVVWIKPKMSFKQILDKYGFPVVRKEVAQRIHEYRVTKSEKLKHRILYGCGNAYKSGKLPNKWQFLLKAPFKISHLCCNYMKKNISKNYEKQTGNMPMLGTMAVDSHLRQQSYMKTGCNNFDAKRPKSTPLAFWTEPDIWKYITLYNIKYSKIYDMGYHNTGCMFCCFGEHLKYSKFELMKKTHPKLYDYCMNQLGLKKVLNYVARKPIGLFDPDEEDTCSNAKK
jgi:3'-phosphoadenosine 5'-phosphosulfate sulfotransferase (PAPS reductase)/FAD synthetase